MSGKVAVYAPDHDRWNHGSGSVLFRKMALPYQDQVEASKDGKLGYNDLRNDLRKEASELKSKVSPVIQGLSGREPVWGDVKLSPESVIVSSKRSATICALV